MICYNNVGFIWFYSSLMSVTLHAFEPPDMKPKQNTFITVLPILIIRNGVRCMPPVAFETRRIMAYQ